MKNGIDFEFITEKPHIENENDPLEFGFKNVCASLCQIIKKAPSPFTIGLIGKWGSGKSTLLENLAVELGKETIPVFNFDVWKHKDDSLRRTFLKELHEFLCAPHFKDIYTKKELSKQVYASTKNSNDVVSFLKEKWGQHLLAIAIITTVIVVVSGLIHWLFGLIGIDILPVLKTLLSAITGIVTVSVFVKYIDQFIKTEKKEEVKERYIDPHQFEDEFKDIIKSIKSKRLIISFDNIDRIQGGDVISVITTIKTFLEPIRKENYNASVVFIIPCDHEAIRKVVSDKHTNADEFLRKIFNTIIWLPNFHTVELESYARKLLIKTKVRSFDNPDIAEIIIKTYRENPRQVVQFINTLLSQYLILKTKEDSNEFGGNFHVDENVQMLVKFISLRQRFPLVMSFIESERIYRTDVNLENLGFKHKPILPRFNLFVKDELNGINDEILPLLFTLKYSEQEKSMPGISVLFDLLERNEIDKATSLFKEIVKEDQLASFDDLIGERIISNKIKNNEARTAILANSLIEVLLNDEEIIVATNTYKLIIQCLSKFRNQNFYSAINAAKTWEFIQSHGNNEDVDYPLTQWMGLINSYVSDDSNKVTKNDLDKIAVEVLQIATEAFLHIKTMSIIAEVKRFAENYISKYAPPYSTIQPLTANKDNRDRYLSDYFVRNLIEKVSIEDFIDDEYESLRPFNILYFVSTNYIQNYKDDLFVRLKQVSESIEPQSQQFPALNEVYHIKLAKFFAVHNHLIGSSTEKITEIIHNADRLYDTENREENRGIINFYLTVFNQYTGDYKTRMSDAISHYFEDANYEKLTKSISDWDYFDYSEVFLIMLKNRQFNNEVVLSFVFGNAAAETKILWITTLLPILNKYGIDLIERSLELLSNESVVGALIAYLHSSSDMSMNRRAFRVLEHVETYSDKTSEEVLALFQKWLFNATDGERRKIVREFVLFTKTKEPLVLEKLCSIIVQHEKPLSLACLNILLDHKDSITKEQQVDLIEYSFDRLVNSEDFNEIRLLYEIIESQDVNFGKEKRLNDRLESLEANLLKFEGSIKDEHLHMLISLKSEDPIIKKLQSKLIKAHKNIFLTSTERIRDLQSGMRTVSLDHGYLIGISSTFPEFREASSY